MVSFHCANPAKAATPLIALRPTANYYYYFTCCRSHNGLCLGILRQYRSHPSQVLQAHVDQSESLWSEGVVFIPPRSYAHLYVPHNHRLHSHLGGNEWHFRRHEHDPSMEGSSYYRSHRHYLFTSQCEYYIIPLFHHQL